MFQTKLHTISNVCNPALCFLIPVSYHCSVKVFSMSGHWKKYLDLIISQLWPNLHMEHSKVFYLTPELQIWVNGHTSWVVFFGSKWLNVCCSLLFSEVGIEYCPPSQYLLPVLEQDCGKQETDGLDILEEAWKVQCVCCCCCYCCVYTNTLWVVVAVIRHNSKSLSFWSFSVTE